MNTLRVPALALATALAACGGSSKSESTTPENAAADAPAEKPRTTLSYLPRDSAVVVGFNLERARESKLWAAHKSKLQAVDGYQQLVSACGIDPAERLTSVWLAMGQTGAQPEEHVLLIQGVSRASVDQCVSTLSQAGEPVTTRDEGLFTAYQMGTTVVYAWWIDDATVALTPAATTSARLSVIADDREGVEANAAIMSMLEQTNAAAAMRVAGAPAAGSEYAASLQPLGAVPQSFFGDADAPAGVDARFVMVFDAAPSARAVHDQLAAQVAELKQQPFVGSYLSGFKLGTSGTEVNLAMTMSEQDLGALLQMMVSFM